MIVIKKPRPNLHRVSEKPEHEKLAWPGLNAKDHLSRVVSLALKEAKETREKEDWAKNQVARVLDFVPPHTAMKLVFLETRRRGSRTPGSSKLFYEFLRRWSASVEGLGARVGRAPRKSQTN